MKVLIETSARHVHLNQRDFISLFGEDHKLTIKRNLSQPGQFLSNEKINIMSNNIVIKNVSILGPLRDQTQVEISLTDARKLKMKVPIRLSGDLSNTPGCILEGPCGIVNLINGIIVAQRHIHLDPRTADENNFCNNQNVNVEILSDKRKLIFSDVIIRVNKNFEPAMHIDTDEANAANISSNIYGNII